MPLKKVTERVRDLNNRYVPITINGVIGERLAAVGLPEQALLVQLVQESSS